MEEVILSTLIIAWLISSHLGTVFTWWVRRDAELELKAIYREQLNSVAEIETKSHLRQENVRLIIQVIFDVIGWSSIAGLGDEPQNDVNWFSVFLFMSLNFLITYNSWVAYHSRKRSLAVLRTQKKRDEDGA